MIYLHHLNYRSGIGAIAVTYFFVLSGFLVAFGYRNKFQKLDLSTYKQFMMNRLLRLYPLHLLAFIISIYVVYLTGFKTNWIYAVMNLFLVQTYSNIGIQVFSFSSISWFIADCIFLYSVTPFVLFTLNKTKISSKFKLLLMLELLVLASGFIVAYFFKGNVLSFSTGWWFIYISPYNRLFDYLIGLIGGIIFALLVEKIQKKYSFLVFSVLELCAIIAGYLSYKLHLFSFADSLGYDMAYVPTGLFIIFVFAFQGGLLSKLLSSKIFVKLGELSFPIIMIHKPCIVLTTLVLGGKIYWVGEKNHFLAQILLFGAILCIADAINRYYEKPLKNWIKKISLRNVVLNNHQLNRGTGQTDIQ